jgi:hypothetical protein
MLHQSSEVKLSIRGETELFNPVADFIAMRKDIQAESRLISIWGFLLNVPTLLGGLYFANHLEGMAVIASILVSLLIATQMHKRTPLSRLMGLCHVVFIPTIILFAMQVGQTPLTTPFGIWSTYSLFLMSICVLIDAFDLYRYFVQGNRTYSA